MNVALPAVASAEAEAWRLLFDLSRAHPTAGRAHRRAHGAAARGSAAVGGEFGQVRRREVAPVLEKAEARQFAQLRSSRRHLLAELDSERACLLKGPLELLRQQLGARRAPGVEMAVLITPRAR